MSKATTIAFGIIGVVGLEVRADRVDVREHLRPLVALDRRRRRRGGRARRPRTAAAACRRPRRCRASGCGPAGSRAPGSRSSYVLIATPRCAPVATRRRRCELVGCSRSSKTNRLWKPRRLLRSVPRKMTTSMPASSQIPHVQVFHGRASSVSPVRRRVGRVRVAEQARRSCVSASTTASRRALARGRTRASSSRHARSSRDASRWSSCAGADPRLQLRLPSTCGTRSAT